MLRLTRGQFLLSPLLLSAAKKLKVVFVCGDHQYSGEFTLPSYAAELGKRYGFEMAVLKSAPDQNGELDIPGLEALGSADLAVLFLRRWWLPEDQLGMIDRYVRSGKPVIGLQTSSSAFRYPKEDSRGTMKIGVAYRGIVKSK